MSVHSVRAMLHIPLRRQSLVSVALDYHDFSTSKIDAHDVARPGTISWCSFVSCVTAAAPRCIGHDDTSTSILGMASALDGSTDTLEQPASLPDSFEVGSCTCENGYRSTPPSPEQTAHVKSRVRIHSVGRYSVVSDVHVGCSRVGGLSSPIQHTKSHLVEWSSVRIMPWW